MKNFAKILSLLLALTMLLCFPVAVSAAELEDAPIDESRTGSLTIYKYDLTNAEKDGVWDSSYVSTGVFDQSGVNDMLGGGSSTLGNGETGYRETLRFFLEHQRMPEAEEFESLCQTVYAKVRSSNYRVSYEDIQHLYAKRLDSYTQRVQRDMEAGITLESLTKQPKQKKTGKAPRPRKRKKRQPAATEFWQDDRFFFIAGYTSGGAPYGVTWEEMGLEPWEDLPL